MRTLIRHKISQTLKRKFAEGMINAFKGKKHIIKSRQKMSKSLKGRKAWNKGIKMWQNKPNPFKGKNHSEETKKRWKKIRKGICYSPATTFKKGEHVGENNLMWKGGVSKQKSYFQTKNKEWNIKNRNKRRHLNRLRRAIERGANG